MSTSTGHEGERRQITVFFSDLSGYTALTEPNRHITSHPGPPCHHDDPPAHIACRLKGSLQHFGEFL